MNKHATLLVAKNVHLYFFDSCKEVDIVAGKQLLQPAFFTDVFKESLAAYELIIFLDYGFELEMVWNIRKLTKAKIILFFWNYLTDEKKLLIEEIRQRKIISEMYSFDPLEAKKYKLKHNSSFYSKNQRVSNSEVSYDIFFGATDNGRKEQALDLRQRFDSLRLTSDFYLLDGQGNEQEGYVPYTEYLAIAAKSKSTLEIMRKDQTGITLRTLESIYFQKKLITTNKMIRYYTFYRPENIFILNEDPYEELVYFLETPYKKLNPSFLEYFDIEQWIQRFVNDEQDFRKEYKPSLLNI